MPHTVLVPPKTSSTQSSSTQPLNHLIIHTMDPSPRHRRVSQPTSQSVGAVEPAGASCSRAPPAPLPVVIAMPPIPPGGQPREGPCPPPARPAPPPPCAAPAFPPPAPSEHPPESPRLQGTQCNTGVALRACSAPQRARSLAVAPWGCLFAQPAAPAQLCAGPQRLYPPTCAAACHPGACMPQHAQHALGPPDASHSTSGREPGCRLPSTERQRGGLPPSKATYKPSRGCSDLRWRAPYASGVGVALVGR